MFLTSFAISMERMVNKSRLCAAFAVVKIRTYQCAETAAQDCLSEDALVHLKSYKYSSVDKSLTSYYILQPYASLPTMELHWHF